MGRPSESALNTHARTSAPTKPKKYFFKSAFGYLQSAYLNRRKLFASWVYFCSRVQTSAPKIPIKYLCVPRVCVLKKRNADLLVSWVPFCLCVHMPCAHNSAPKKRSKKICLSIPRMSVFQMHRATFFLPLGPLPICMHCVHTPPHQKYQRNDGFPFFKRNLIVEFPGSSVVHMRHAHTPLRQIYRQKCLWIPRMGEGV